jgi:magnesium-protoporphyrin O-methyltransferase
MVTITSLIIFQLIVVAHAFRVYPIRHFLASRGMKQLASVVDDKAEVTNYFNNEGFSRWNKIYSDSNEVNKVQLDIRNGHQQTIDKVLNWLVNEDNTKKTLCDAGCGVGSLALPMSSMFKSIAASDISAAMTQEASGRAMSMKMKNIKFETKDMESLSGSYDTVTCIDVMIHYPTSKVRLLIILAIRIC